MNAFVENSLAVGVSFKLAAIKGDTILGTITIPRYGAKILFERGSVQMSAVEKSPMVRALKSFDDFMMQPIAVVTIFRSVCHIDAVEMHGVSLEEFERIPGCSFAPSAAYLRSMLDV